MYVHWKRECRYRRFFYVRKLHARLFLFPSARLLRNRKSHLLQRRKLKSNSSSFFPLLHLLLLLSSLSISRRRFYIFLSSSLRSLIPSIHRILRMSVYTPVDVHAATMERDKQKKKANMSTSRYLLLNDRYNRPYISSFPLPRMGKRRCLCILCICFKSHS